MSILATEKATATNGREGQVVSEDGQISLQISPPGGNKPGTNPETLFAAGYAACFGQAIKAMAGQHDVSIDAENTSVEAVVNLHKDDEKGFYIDVTLNCTLPDVDVATAEKLVKSAHEICPYSKATSGNVDVTLQANGAPLAQAA